MTIQHVAFGMALAFAIISAAFSVIVSVGSTAYTMRPRERRAAALRAGFWSFIISLGLWYMILGIAAALYVTPITNQVPLP